MKNQLIRNTLNSQGFIQVNKYLSRRLSLDAAIVLGELVWQLKRNEDNGTMLSEEYFRVFRKQIGDSTTLSAHKQRAAEALLEAHRLIRVKVGKKQEGNAYRLNETEIQKFFEKGD